MDGAALDRAPQDNLLIQAIVAHGADEMPQASTRSKPNARTSTLSAGSADIIGQLLDGETPDINLNPFRHERFRPG